MATRTRSWLLRWRRELSIIGGALGAAAIVITLLGPVASWSTPGASGLSGKDKADAINATRQILLAAVGGLALLTGAAFTTRTYYLSRRGQLTDRYTKAIALLASDKITERLGGIYALEHLMIESERDHETVVEVLSAFVREQTSIGAGDDPDWAAVHHHHDNDDRPRLATDVQATLTVIGRRPSRPERSGLVDLSLADLCGANLVRLNLAHAHLWRTKLRNAVLLDTRLDHANLCWAQLQDAVLTDAHFPHAQLMRCRLEGTMLKGVNLRNANLRDAYLQKAHLAEADLRSADLEDAALDGADLTGDDLLGGPARGLDADQLRRAIITDTTKLPDDIRRQLAASTSGGASDAAESPSSPTRHDGQRESSKADNIHPDLTAPTPPSDKT